MSSSSQAPSLFSADFIQNLNNITNKKVSKLNKVINEMGMDVETQEKWVCKIKEELNQLYDMIMENAVAHKEKILIDIEELLKESERLCKLLQTKMPQHGSQDLSFFEERRLLKKHVEQLQGAVRAREKQLEILKIRQLELCKNLGREPKSIKKVPLPNNSELEDFENHIKALELEVFKREEHYMHIKFKIMELAADLEIKPSLDLENVLFSDNSIFQVTDKNMKWLDDYYGSLQVQYNNMKKEIKILREVVGRLWIMLSEDVEKTTQFMQRHLRCTFTTFTAWKNELIRCNTLKKENMQKIVENLRNELSTLWEKCHKTNSEREEFTYYRTKTYTEELISYHTIEIDKLKNYYQNNHETFTLLEKWQESWNNLTQLEEKASAPNRFKNRGGTLLQEEKERNALQKRIPKYEERLLELSNNYKERMGKDFLSWGERIDNLIKKAHENYKVEKETKLSARKQQRATPTTPTITRSKDTISTPKSSSKRPPKTTLFTSNKKCKVSPCKQLPAIQLNDQTINLDHHLNEKNVFVKLDRLLLAQPKGRKGNWI
nr:protein regulator of cytokinesis 1-like isoform X1 [Onthophagus taurus]